jgi:ADP-dependent NAD(P)H-hydrate dehydratase / NAD(P)H-hydrate epimerase
MKIVSVEQMLAIEKSADAGGLSYQQMMHNAGRGIADWLGKNLSLKAGVIGLVGSGNNGGDTIMALTWLAKWGVRTLAFLVKPRASDPLLDEYQAQGGAVIDVSENKYLNILQAALLPGVVVLDGILGTGFRMPLRGSLLRVMAGIQKQLEKRLDLLVVAVDCPSGVDCDTGEVSDVTFFANYTLTMAAMKKGLLAHPARSFAGELQFISIGLDDLSNYISDNLPTLVDRDLIRDLIPQRPDSGHKGTFGTCLVLAGSTAYTGAAYLTGKAAYRAGCGLVHMAALPDVHQTLAGRLIEAVWTVLPDVNGFFDTRGIDRLQEVYPYINSIVVGPGWGLSDQNMVFLEKLLHSITKQIPALFDADGLKLLKHIDRWWTLLPDQTVLTPHPGEMAVLTGLDIDTIQANRWEIAKQYAHRWNVHLVLKGAMTVVASPGSQVYVNPLSDASLATAGSGDVLSGLIGGLLSQGIPADKASLAGVWVHGIAGQIAGRVLGASTSVTALDILECLPDAFLKAKEAGQNASL